MLRVPLDDLSVTSPGPQRQGSVYESPDSPCSVSRALSPRRTPETQVVPSLGFGDWEKLSAIVFDNEHDATVEKLKRAWEDEKQRMQVHMVERVGGVPADTSNPSLSAPTFLYNPLHLSAPV